MCLFLVGCAGELSQGGKAIFLTHSDSAYLSNCKIVGQVRVKTNISGLWDIEEARKQIKVDLRNETALRFRSADTVSYSDLEVSKLDRAVESMGTAFKCFDLAAYK